MSYKKNVYNLIVKTNEIKCFMFSFKCKSIKKKINIMWNEMSLFVFHYIIYMFYSIYFRYIIVAIVKNIYSISLSTFNLNWYLVLNQFKSIQKIQLYISRKLQKVLYFPKLCWPILSIVILHASETGLYDDDKNTVSTIIYH